MPVRTRSGFGPRDGTRTAKGAAAARTAVSFPSPIRRVQTFMTRTTADEAHLAHLRAFGNTQGYARSPIFCVGNGYLQIGHQDGRGRSMDDKKRLSMIPSVCSEAKLNGPTCPNNPKHPCRLETIVAPCRSEPQPNTRATNRTASAVDVGARSTRKATNWLSRGRANEYSPRVAPQLFAILVSTRM